MSARTRVAALAVTAPLALAFSACSLLTPSLTETQLESEITSTLLAQAGVTADNVDCPGPLKGEVGTSEECTVTASGDTITVKVTVTSVENKTIKFDINEA